MWNISGRHSLIKKFVSISKEYISCGNEKTQGVHAPLMELALSNAIRKNISHVEHRHEATVKKFAS